MYHPVKIEPLSEPQIKKLLKGLPVRVKKGNHHVIHVNADQHKKLTKAAIKGSGITLSFDPYQAHHHGDMHGTGIMSKLKSAAKSVAAFGKKAVSKAQDVYHANEAKFQPLKNELKKYATTKVGEYAERYAPEIEKRFGSIGATALQGVQDEALSQIEGQGFREFAQSAQKFGRKVGSKAKAFYNANEAKFVPLKQELKKYAKSKVSEYGEKLAPEIERRFGSIGSTALQGAQQEAMSQIEGQGLKEIGRAIKKFSTKAASIGKKVIQTAAPALAGIAASEFGPMGSILAAKATQAVVGGGPRGGRGGVRGKRGGALLAAGYGFE